MAEEAKADDVIVGTEQTTPEVETQETTPEIDYKAEYEKSQESIEKLKSDNAGLDRKIGELSTSFSDLRKQHETEAEKTERESKEQVDNWNKKETDFRDKELGFAKKENDFNVKVKALELGFTVEDIEALKFTSVEHVESTKAYADRLKDSTKEAQTKEIENALSGSRDNLNGKTEVDNMPSAFKKAFA